MAALLQILLCSSSLSDAGIDVRRELQNSTTPAPTPKYTEPTKGGAVCQENWQCGIQGDNWLLEKKVGVASGSLTSQRGSCEDGQCVCKEGYACGNCAVTGSKAADKCCSAKPGTALTDIYCQTNCAVPPINPDLCVNCECSFDFSPAHCVNLCDHQWGGGACEFDYQCLNGGICLGLRSAATGFRGSCSCAVDWGCAHCELPINDLWYKGGHGPWAQCPGSTDEDNSNSSFVSGNGNCLTAADCGNGICQPPTGGLDCTNPGAVAQFMPGARCACQCSPGFGCSDCSQPTADLLSGAKSCGCDGVQCPPANTFLGIVANSRGQCNPKTGACDCYWPYTGTDCSVDPCAADVNPCATMEHATCVVDSVTSQAKCECVDGWSGEGCTVAPKCTTDADCGVWSPIPQAKADGFDPNFACSETGLCVEDKYGGTCDTATGQCNCNPRFACNGTCTAMGDATKTEGPGSCFLGTGGGLCTSDFQCQRLGDGGNGSRVAGYCVEGRCICRNGFTCPLCDFAQQSLGDGQVCPVYSPENLTKYGQYAKPTLAPTAPPTPSAFACGPSSYWVLAVDNANWYTGSAEMLCMCQRGYYAVTTKVVGSNDIVATIPSGTDSAGRTYPDIRGAYPYTEILPSKTPGITCKDCPDSVTRSSCRDDVVANWQSTEDDDYSGLSDGGGLSGGAMAGVVIVSIIGVAVVGYVVMSAFGGRHQRGVFNGRHTVQMSRGGHGGYPGRVL